jgi:sugar phosphate isomerase/epimerase
MSSPSGRGAETAGAARQAFIGPIDGKVDETVFLLLAFIGNFPNLPVMIKLAFMTSVCPDWDLERILDAMNRYGFEGLEPRVGWPNSAGFQTDLSAQQRALLRERIEGEGRRICCVATGARFALADAGQRELQVKETLAAIDLAADLGAPFVRTFGGDPGGGEMNALVNRAVDAYRPAVERAKKMGVTLLLETHDSWCHSSLVREVVERVGDDHLRVLWDIMHPARMFERPEETMKTIGHLTRHVHVHDGRWPDPDGRIETVALGDGRIDHRTPLRLLAEGGYDGYVSVEVIHKPGSGIDPDPVLRQYAEALRSMLA